MQDSKVDKNSTTRKKTGGRQKGTPNKDTSHINDVCKRMGLDPIEALAYYAMGKYVELGLPEFIEKQGFQGVVVKELSIPIEIRVDCLKTLVSYMYPKRKAIEHSVSEESKGSFTFNYNTKPMNQDEKG